MAFNFHGGKNWVNFANWTWSWDSEFWTRWPPEDVSISTNLWFCDSNFRFNAGSTCTFLENGGGEVLPWWCWLWARSLADHSASHTFLLLFQCCAPAILGSSEKIFFPAGSCQHKLVGASPMCQLQEVLLAQSLLKTSMSFLILWITPSLSLSPTAFFSWFMFW